MLIEIGRGVQSCESSSFQFPSESLWQIQVCYMERMAGESKKDKTTCSASAWMLYIFMSCHQVKFKGKSWVRQLLVIIEEAEYLRFSRPTATPSTLATSIPTASTSTGIRAATRTRIWASAPPGSIINLNQKPLFKRGLFD